MFVVPSGHRCKFLLAADRALGHAGCLWIAGGVLGRPGGQGQRVAVGVAFAASGHTGIREQTIAALIDLNPAAAVRVQAVELLDHGRATLSHTAVDVCNWISANIPGACNRFRGNGAVRVLRSATPQVRGHRGVLGSATIEIVAFLIQGQIVDALTIVDAANRLGFHSGTFTFAEIERVGSVEHGAHVVRFAVHLALVGGRLTFDRHHSQEPNTNDQ